MRIVKQMESSLRKLGKPMAVSCHIGHGSLHLRCSPKLYDCKIIRSSLQQIAKGIRRDGRFECRSAAGAAGFTPPDSARQADAIRPYLSPDGIIEPDGTVVKQVPLDPEDRRKLWKAAIKLPMYSVGLAPILVSATAAFVYTGAFAPLRTLGLCVAAVAIIAWLNLSNDVFDSLTGVDKGRNKPESIVNLTQKPRLVFLAAHVLLLTGAGIMFHLMSSVPHPWAAKALYAAICCGYLYQGPPFRWSYLGLGEPLCFLAFGPLATNAFYLAQIPPALAAPAAGAAPLSVLPGPAIALSILVGVSTTVILFCSHFHQVEGDRAAGKMSPLVRMGTQQGAATLKLVVGATYAVTLVLSLLGVLPFAVWTSAMVAYGFAGEMVKLAESEAHNPTALRPLKVLATRWHIGFTAMLALGLIVQKLMVM